MFGCCVLSGWLTEAIVIQHLLILSQFRCCWLVYCCEISSTKFSNSIVKPNESVWLCAVSHLIRPIHLQTHKIHILSKLFDESLLLAMRSTDSSGVIVSVRQFVYYLAHKMYFLHVELYRRFWVHHTGCMIQLVH